MLEFAATVLPIPSPYHKVLITLDRHPLNGLFSRTTWVKPIWSASDGPFANRFHLTRDT